MKCSRSLRGLVSSLCLVAFLMVGMCAAYASINSTTIKAYAEEDLNGYTDDGGSSAGGFDGEVTQDDKDVANWISKQRGMTSEQVEGAAETLSPLTSAVGYVIGGIIVCTVLALFFMTALDLLYITFPPIRPTLYKGPQQQGGAMPGMGGMGGYGMRGMGGMMGAMGAQQQQQGTVQRQWVSDEAVFCSTLLANSQQPQGGAMPGMGGMGAMGMGAMGAQQQQPMPMKSVISVYFKKRIFFMILLVVCIIVLTSSALMGTGANLAQWGLSLIDLLNGYIPIG